MKKFRTIIWYSLLLFTTVVSAYSQVSPWETDKAKLYFPVVDDAITKLGIDPAACKEKEAGKWTITKGEYKIWVDCWYIEKEERVYFQVLVPVAKIPETADKEFYKTILELNDELYGVGFTVYDGVLWIKHIREAEGMDKTEAYEQILRAGNYADTEGENMKTKFSLEAYE